MGMSHGESLWKALWQFPEKLNIYFPHLPCKLASHLVQPRSTWLQHSQGYIMRPSLKNKRERERTKKAYIHTEDVHSNFIQSSRTLGKVQMSTNKSMDKQILEHLLSGKLLSITKWLTDRHSNTANGKACRWGKRWLWNSINALQPGNSKQGEKLTGAGHRENWLWQSTSQH